MKNVFSIKTSLTYRDIADGKKGDACLCPYAIAITRGLTKEHPNYRAKVTFTYIYAYDNDADQMTLFFANVPDWMKRDILDFDHNKKISARGEFTLIFSTKEVEPNDEPPPTVEEDEGFLP